MRSTRTSFSVLAVLSLALCVGCTSPSTTSAPEKSASAVRILTSSGAALALANNPRYVPAAEAIIASIDAVATGDSLLTADLITRFVASICVERGMSPTEAVVFTSLARTAWVAYVEDNHPNAPPDVEISTTNPQVRRYLDAFKLGLKDALAAIAATAPPA